MPVKIDTAGLFKLQADSSKAITQGLQRAGKDLAKLASDLAPVGPGVPSHLKDSYTVRKKGNGVVEVAFGVDLPDMRAPAQEEGTVFHDAQPYVEPALKEIDVAFYIKKDLGLK
jgi:hypothetical protein